MSRGQIIQIYQIHNVHVIVQITHVSTHVHINHTAANSQISFYAPTRRSFQKSTDIMTTEFRQKQSRTYFYFDGSISVQILKVGDQSKNMCFGML